MKRLAFKHLLWAGLAGMALWILGTTPAWADPIVVPSGQVATPPDVATLLAPMLAAATGIERLLETAWNLIENAARQLIAELGLGKVWAANARAQVIAAEKAFAVAVKATPNDPFSAALQAAEKGLLNAQLHFRSALESEQYKSLKQVVSIIVGVAFGIGISITAGLDMFQLLKIYPTAGLLGEIVTGIIIGAGSGPVHSLIGLIQQARDAVDQAANLSNKRAAAQVVQHAAEIPPLADGARGLGIEPEVSTPAPTAADAFILSRLASR